jgi:hypothetical protein
MIHVVETVIDSVGAAASADRVVACDTGMSG